MEAVLGNVVAHCQHQRLIGLGQWLERRSGFPLLHRLTISKTYQRQLFGKRGQLVGQLALAAEHLGAAVENQLILTAYLIEVNQWQTGLIAALGHQLAADPGFLLIIGRGIDSEQQLCPRGLGGQRRTRLP